MADSASFVEKPARRACRRASSRVNPRAAAAVSAPGATNCHLRRPRATNRKYRPLRTSHSSRIRASPHDPEAATVTVKPTSDIDRSLAHEPDGDYPPPVELALLDNRGRSVESAIEESLRDAQRLAAAVAYSTPDGLSVFEEATGSLGRRGGSARFLTGLDDLVTDLRGLQRVAELPGAECRVFLPRFSDDGARFHPKLYIFEGRNEANLIVGSANLTGAGLATNYEAAVWLRGAPGDPLIGAAWESFGLLWDNPRAVPLTEHVRESYERARRRLDGALRAAAADRDYQQAMAGLRAQLTRSLMRPDSRRWLMITSPGNFDICLRLGRWGDQRYDRISRVKPGDGIVFYITRTHELGGLAVALTEARTSQERPWPDRDYPYQMDVEFIAVPDPRPSLRPLIPQLELFEGTTEGWGQRLQTTLRPLTERDFGLLSRSLSSLSGTAL